MEQKTTDYSKFNEKDAAIIGISLRFPGSPDMETFWEHLIAGKDLIKEIPVERWDWQQYMGNAAEEINKSSTKWAGTLDNIEGFDASFFNISPREANLMDPQQRILLELAWHALEDAGYRASCLAGTRTGVFIGASHNDYRELIDQYLTEIDPYLNSGTDSSIISNRISYFFNFHGTSITINTACSSSLVAVHQAVRAIRGEECQLALAGGANICWTPKLFVACSSAGMLSNDGKCKTFDEAADGYVRSEGAGLILLKPLRQAIEEGDHIYAIVKGTAVNHGGKASALTVPSAEAQARLLVNAYEDARVSPDTISYIETHGTGTTLGDPIEIHGLKTAFTQLFEKFHKETYQEHSCGLGSVKTNIGHLESAAGIAGLIKTVLAMKYKKLPATLNLHKINPLIKIENTPFFFVKETRDWKPLEKENGDIVPRRAGVSSFGFGGTNAHVVLEEWPNTQGAGRPDLSPGEPQLILLSAKSAERLNVYAGKIKEFLEKAEYTIGFGSHFFNHLQMDLLRTAAKIIDVGENDINPDEGLEEYGFDAVKLAAFIQRLNEMYDLEINPGLVPGNMSLRVLSRRLGSQYASTLGNHYGKGVTHAETPIRFPDVAYTLQVGREAMEERLAIVASNLRDMKEKLTRHLEKQEQMQTRTGEKEVYRENIAEHKTTSQLLSGGRETEEFIRILIDDRNLNKLARLWVSGVDIPWELAHAGPGSHPQRISLPTYPFVNERYWVPVNAQIPYKKPFEGPRLHLLIDRVAPELSLQQGIVFLKTLKKTDPVLRDHQVHGQCIFPGVGYLEMGIVVGAVITGGTQCQLARVVWREPLAVPGEERELWITIKKDNQDLVFRVQSHGDGREVIHMVGQLLVPGDMVNTPPEVRISIEEIRAKCPYHMDKTVLYRRAAEMGVRYGAYFQGVIDVWSNPHEAVSKFRLPTEFAHEWSGYTLHPAVMDSALQTIIGIFAADNPDYLPPVVPFAAAKVEMSHPLPASGYAYAITAAPLRYNVFITDENGTVCLKFHQVAFRPFKKTSLDFLYMPTWKPVRLPAPQSRPSTPGKLKVLIFYPPGESVLKPALAQAHGKDEVHEIELDPLDSLTLENRALQLQDVRMIYFLGGIQEEDIDTDDIDAWEQAQERGVLSLFRLVKFLIAHGFAQRVLQLKVITNDVLQVTPGAPVKPYGASLHGLVKSMAKEYPGWKINCIDVSLEEIKTNSRRMDEVVRQILDEPAHPAGNETALRNGKRYVRTIEPLLLPGVSRPPFKQQGVYFILGGAGGIGLETAHYLAKTVQARLVLVGRSQLKPGQQEKISRIEACGGKVLYIRANAADLESMKNALHKAKSHFGKINGVFHSAIVLRDITLQNMEEETFRAALQPKVKGSAILHHVFKGEQLDFMIFFSAAQSFAGNPGQSNYAAGCTFKDAFALLIHRCEPYPVKIINWGYWGSVGIVASEAYAKRLKAQGIESIEPGEGMEAMQRILAHRVTQVIPLKALRPYLEKIGVDMSHYREVYPEQIPSVSDKMVSLTTLPAFDTVEVHQYWEGYSEMIRWIPGLLLHVFQEMGVFRGKDEHRRKDELQERMGIIPRYTRLYNALLHILENAGLVRCSSDEIVTASLPDNPGGHGPGNMNTLEKEKDRLMAGHPQIIPYIRLLWACFKDFSHVLTGRKSHMEVMFPGGSKTLVEGVYQGTPLSDYFHRLAAQVVRQYIRQRLQSDPEAQIHILEVGAGTGSTSRFVFKAVREYAKHLRYWYTDISQGFTQYGETAFGADYPFVEFRVLDIEGPIERQGFKPGSMDLVLGSNVLHATRQMVQTLHHAKRLLKTNGLLVINEVTHVEEFSLLTFGLTEGWWRFEDEEIRLPGSPLLGPHQWKELLETNGIRWVHIFQFPDAAVEEFGQCVMVGESDGNVQVPSLEPAPELELKPGLEPGPGLEFEIGTPPGPTLNFEPVSKKKLQEDLLDYVKTVFSEVLKIQKQRFDSTSGFERYGLDSLVSMDIIHRLEKDFGKLPATLLFENMTLGELTDYFLSRHGQRAAELFNHREPPGGFPPQPHHMVQTPKTDKEVMETPLDPFPVKKNGSLRDRVLQLSDSEVDELLQLLSNQ
ncbi:MAG: SDR family NAD(P)-dependent oxidoreductase [Candidatus Aminicenantes bacterium]|nr:MAG: SDR family NAD(P)-dependent oxidoreductase [Candidatus Aminicenantes bacterium]